ncbi:MAG: hypothetical protein Q9157_003896 [Trypethelium eluteriae]
MPEHDQITLHDPRDALSVGVFDPFDCFAADTSELPALLENPLARQAGEPIINFNSEMGYQGLHTVFRSSIADPALLNAILMALTFAVHNDPMDAKFLSYRGQTLRWVNERLQSTASGVAPATIGAVLFLIGVEARRRDTKSVEMHMSGLALIMQLCTIHQAILHDGIKRAIFWQDLLSAILTGSRRIMSHEFFAELSWTRDPLCLSIAQIPEGFGTSEDVLGNTFLSIVQDIRALQVIRDTTDVDQRDAVTIMHLDNHQASIESRLYNLGKDPMRFQNPTLYCCILTAHICTYMLFTEVWGASWVPLYLASWLLEQLQTTGMKELMNEHRDLFLWVICVGGTFVDPGDKQAMYGQLLSNQLKLGASISTESDLQELLQKFIWSNKTFGKRWRGFLSESEVKL